MGSSVQLRVTEESSNAAAALFNIPVANLERCRHVTGALPLALVRPGNTSATVPNIYPSNPSISAEQNWRHHALSGAMAHPFP